MFAPAYNPTDRPVLIDDAGRQLGGGEWGPVDTTSNHVKTAGDRDLLVVKTVDELADVASTHPAHDARERAKTLEDRRRVYTDADADAVRTAAGNAGVALDVTMVDPDGGPDESRSRGKAELVRDLVHVDGDPEQLLNPPTAAAEPSPSADDDVTDTSPATSGSTAGRRAAGARKTTAAPTIPDQEA